MNIDDPLDDSPEPVEAYCVHCRETVEMEDPIAVWTRRGVPATRGDCPICGGTVFRMGKSSAHERMNEPEARVRVKLGRGTVYVNFAPADAAVAEGLAADLERIGVTCWLHEHEASGFNWASGVHPALSSCDRMIYILSSAALTDPQVEQAWRYFREKRKPIVVVFVDSIAPPDDLRRRPRFDLTTNYKAAFRQLLQALNDGR